MPIEHPTPSRGGGAGGGGNTNKRPKDQKDRETKDRKTERPKDRETEKLIRCDAQQIDNYYSSLFTFLLPSAILLPLGIAHASMALPSLTRKILHSSLFTFHFLTPCIN